ncbi:hypothetical protein F511_25134 [Dorcoceras hygrometricum]|uniref:Uncharacterized protein n=1 Tax=Dorcoceras hygrometricum TaxID=472368 RepID=A0A2Z7BPP7_9LAMI|nr:hypothetical protein F511_25134 [Dorcoceras hygrometricum]
MVLLNENPFGGSTASAKPAAEPRRLGGPSPKLSKRLSEKFERTKEVASAGMEKSVEKTKVAAKKVKEGATTGVHWIKLKYSKSSLFQKK